MIVPYFPDESKEHYYNYYANQVGNGFGVFQGTPIHTGNGIGSLLRGLAKSTLPLLKAGGKLVGKQLLSTGLGIAEDVVRGKNIREAAKDNFREGGKALLNDLVSKASGRDGATGERPAKRRRKAQKRPRGSNSSSLFQNVRVEG
jgi:hypothetical protein